MALFDVESNIPWPYLRAKGLLTYPSLLFDLLREMPDLFAVEVLARLDPADCAVLAQVGHPWLAAVLAANLPRAGTDGAVPLMLPEFVGSVARLAWAKANACPWVWGTRTCGAIATGGQLEVLQWAREHHCPWDEETSANAALGGHMAVSKWAWEHNCPLTEYNALCKRRGGRASRYSAVAACARLPVEFGDMRIRR
jgi:hypothetical protein